MDQQILKNQCRDQYKKIKGEFTCSVEIIVFHNVLGGFAPATVAAPLAISVENRFTMDLW
jgi:hypothetical protein